VVDRSQFLHGIADSDTSRAYFKAVPRLRRRAMILNRSLLCAIIAIILTAPFISAMLNVAHEYGGAILFMAALVTFCVSLIDLARETRLALRDSDLRT
jgi:hypothetical protein